MKRTKAQTNPTGPERGSERLIRGAPSRSPDGLRSAIGTRRLLHQKAAVEIGDNIADPHSGYT